MIVRYIKKGKCMNKLAIVFNNQNFHEKFFNFNVIQILKNFSILLILIPINCPITHKFILQNYF